MLFEMRKKSVDNGVKVVTADSEFIIITLDP